MLIRLEEVQDTVMPGLEKLRIKQNQKQLEGVSKSKQKRKMKLNGFNAEITSDSPIFANHHHNLILLLKLETIQHTFVKHRVHVYSYFKDTTDTDKSRKKEMINTWTETSETGWKRKFDEVACLE